MKNANLLGWILIPILLTILIIAIRQSPWGENLHSTPMASGNFAAADAVQKAGGLIKQQQETGGLNRQAAPETPTGGEFTDAGGLVVRQQTNEEGIRDEGLLARIATWEEKARQMGKTAQGPPPEPEIYLRQETQEPMGRPQVVRERPSFDHVMGRREPLPHNRPEQQMVYAPRPVRPPVERPSQQYAYAPRLHGPRSETAQNMGSMVRTNRGRWVFEGQICICGPATPRGVECAIVNY